MKFRLPRLKREPTITPTEDSPSPEDARRALEADRERLEAVKRQTPAYAALGRSLREIREQNHISEHLAALYRGGTP